MARAGAPLGLYGERYGGKPEQVIQSWEPGRPDQSPYRAYITTGAGTSHMVSAFVRDPRSSAQVWSRHGGYPGDPWYLEFHKTRWPGGLKFWRVSQQGADLGQKAPYEPLRAMKSASAQGKHFVDLLAEVSGREDHNVGPSGVIVAPFDTELFGHWWYEGPEFLAAAWRAMKYDGRVHGTTASDHLTAHRPSKGVQLAAGSWGKNGDWSMWFGHETAWTWPQLWRLEELFWGIAREALASEEGRVVLAQAARAMLLAQSSDWQFILSTNEVADYGVRRFRGHVEDTEGLLGGLRHGLDTGEWTGVLEFVARLADRDKIFPDVLDAVRVALGEEQR
jgi:1,4-alpha-glucan branching enzyme